ncbi:hypothetical protein [Brevibacillus sp. NRS-1366]|uniref:hypothetical protein n=1 Tax=Brevibacillus sp. NRS-1366 TaxID=3233899 RepID=UPI003D25ACA1
MPNNFFQKLFRPEKWEIVYSTQDVQKYSEVIAKLQAKSIRTKTETFSGGGGQGGGYGFATTYHILVRADDIHLANDIIHHSK